MPYIDFRTLKASSRYLTPVGNGVWLMDDHRWACVVWEEHRTANRAVLVHADHHWDGLYDYFDDVDGERKMLALDATGLRSLVQRNQYIRFDSFIAPAVRRGLFSEVHFFCKEDEGNDAGLDAEVLQSSDTKQVIHESTDSLARIRTDAPLVFDLCLDLFARAAGEEPGDIWSEAEIATFLSQLAHLIQAAGVVTVSLSFGYSGTAEETRALATFVIPRLVALRGDA